MSEQDFELFLIDFGSTVSIILDLILFLLVFELFVDCLYGVSMSCGWLDDINSEYITHNHIVSLVTE